jgi:hypothetical protein
MAVTRGRLDPAVAGGAENVAQSATAFLPFPARTPPAVILQGGVGKNGAAFAAPQVIEASPVVTRWMRTIAGEGHEKHHVKEV